MSKKVRNTKVPIYGKTSLGSLYISSGISSKIEMYVSLLFTYGIKYNLIIESIHFFIQIYHTHTRCTRTISTIIPHDITFLIILQISTVLLKILEI